MQLFIKLLYNIPEIDNYYFAIFYPYYKKKLEKIKFVYNPCLFYSNELFHNLTQIFFYTA